MTVKTGEACLSNSALRINICFGAAVAGSYLLEGKLYPETFCKGIPMTEKQLF